MKKSIGIDVSMDTLDVALYDGNSYTCKVFENNEAGFRKLEKEIENGIKSDKLISMEATGVYHLKVAVYFQKKGYNVSVINPLITRRYSEMKMLRAKTDPVDSRTIAEYGFQEKPYYFIQKDDKRERISQLLKQIDDLHKMENENKNRIHALKKIPLIDETVLSIYMEIDEYLKLKEHEAEKKIKVIIEEFYSDEYKKLILIPSVGNRVSSLIIGYFGRFENFQNSKQVSSFIGLNSSCRQSGKSINGKGNISKKGNRYMRKIFFMAALSASKHNKACMAQYERLLNRGKSKRVALIAVANKLTRQIFAIMKYDRIYDENYGKNVLRC